MAFVKVVKNKAYFKRYQVRYRRRREGKTDYQARRRLVLQDKNKYNAPKYRFVVRATNTRIVCQVIFATIQGDRVMAEALSTDLSTYGVKVGLTNYPAAYCTGLLCARRLLKAVGMDSSIQGVKEADGEEYHVEEAMEGAERRPFKCLLDVGIVRTSTGNRTFGAMKGACDGGLHIPHSVKRFPGYCTEEGEKEGTYDAGKHRERIYGKHIADYMKEMLDSNPEKYEMHFSKFTKAGVKADDLEAMYKKAHAGIRAKPEKAAKSKKAETAVNIREGNVIKTARGQYTRMEKLTLEQRKERVARKMRIAGERMAAAAAS
eukprot:GHVS01090277.1.p1 GENE.GHVS01090277.1~~GHVS01090277.1.p1  ORF type:complete len:318 (-),score=52.00 GHVS01090277.1:129-1082(-)